MLQGYIWRLTLHKSITLGDREVWIRSGELERCGMDGMERPVGLWRCSWCSGCVVGGEFWCGVFSVLVGQRLEVLSLFPLCSPIFCGFSP